MELRDLAVDGAVVRVAYRDEGDGPAVVLLHGQPGAAANWAPVVERLRERARVIALDRPGYGESGGPARGIGENADVVLALLNVLRIERAVLAGHSWGGGVALSAGLKAPQRVAGLVLVASIGPRTSVGRLDRVLVAPLLGPALTLAGFLALRRLLPLPVVRSRLVRELGTMPRSSVDELVRQVRRRDWRSFVVEQRALIREIDGLAARLPEVVAPAVVLSGELDFVVAPEVGRQLAASLPRADFRLVDRAGHVMQAEAPQAVADAIAELSR
jgi:pimeloyl-ACP methyl ester carboxylesterase